MTMEYGSYENYGFGTAGGVTSASTGGSTYEISDEQKKLQLSQQLQGLLNGSLSASAING